MKTNAEILAELERIDAVLPNIAEGSIMFALYAGKQSALLWVLYDMPAHTEEEK